jgi:RHS repeat-associated protein
MSRWRTLLRGGVAFGILVAAGLTVLPSDSRPQEPALPAPVALHAMTLLGDGRLLVAGGRGPAGWLADVRVVASSSEADGTPLAAARGTHSATLLPDGRVVVAGGVNEGGTLDSIEVIDLATGGVTTLAARLPRAVSEHAGAMSPRGQVVVTGGRDATGRAVATVQAVDGEHDHTVELLPLSTARAGHSATLLTDGRLLIAGGVDGAGAVLASAELYDPTALTSEPLIDRLRTARAGHTATPLPSGDVLIAGGTDANGRVLASVERFDASSRTFHAHALRLATARTHHAAVLLPSGDVVVWGGVDAAGALIAGGEILSLDTGASRPMADLRAALAPDSVTPSVVASRPRDGAHGVSALPQLVVRFSEPVAVRSVAAASVTVTGPDGVVPSLVVPAESGLLLFVTPAARLRDGATHALTLAGLVDTAGRALPTTTIRFTTAGVIGGGGGHGGGGEPGGDRAIPPGDEDVRIQRDPRTGKPISTWQDLPPLMAPPGVTAVSGQVLQLNGEPLADVTLSVEGVSTRTDATGRFLLQAVEAGPGKLTIDARTANRPGVVYGVFDADVNVPAGQTLVLSYTIWMPRLDTRYAVRFPSPTTGVVTLTHPALPGFEIALAPGTVVEDRDGRVITELAITPIPPDRPPFPLPEPFAMYFTVQPGGASLSKGAKVTYSNEHSQGPPGKTWHFWNHEPEGGIGWYRYGRGTVDQDGKRIHADEHARVYKITMSGCCPGATAEQPSTGPTPAGTTDADPVSLSTGLFVLKKTDLVVADTVPISLERTYRQDDTTVREFGVGSRHQYDMVFTRVGTPITQWQEANVILPDGARIHYVVIQSGTWPSQWVYEHRDTPTAFFKSRMVYNATKLAWDVVLKDGTVYRFADHSGRLVEIRDRYGNTVALTRRNLTTGVIDPAGALTRITSPNGRFIDLTYDTAGRIAEATDPLGRIVSYEYDASQRLVKVTDPAGGVKEYTYDAAGRMLTMKDARGLTVLTNEYYTSGLDTGRVKKQTLADPAQTYQFTYANDGQGRITQTDITDPRGFVRRVTFNAAGYELSDTRAVGQPEAQATTYERDTDPLRGGLVRAATDALGRRTEYDYDTYGNVTTIRRLAGTADQITSTFTYEPCVHDAPSGYCRLTSLTPSTATTDGVVTLSYTGLTQATITDALSHATTITYDATGRPAQVLTPLGAPPTTYSYTGGDLTSMTDRLGRTTTWSYDGAGRRVSQTDPRGRTTNWLYSAVNRLLSIADGSGGTTRFTYDGNGNVLTVKDALGNTTTYTYDLMERRAARIDPLGKTETFVYDGRGNLTSHTDRKDQTTTFAYDALNRRIATTGQGYTVGYTWDAGNRLTEVVDSVGGAVTRAFDLFDRLTTETTALGTVRYDNPEIPGDRGYDTLGRRLWMEVPGQTRITYVWDVANRLAQIRQGTQVVSFAYDDANRRTLLTLPNGVSTESQYDAGSRLTALIYRKGGGELGRLTYTYDFATNRAAVGGSFAVTLLPDALASATYNAGSRQTAFGGKTLSYDDNGNLTQITDGSDVTTFGWDRRNRLTSLLSPQPTTATFAYDARGRRASKTINGTTTQFQYDGLDIARELINGNATGYVFGPGIDEVLIRGGAEFFLSDALGSTLLLTDATGAITGSYQYEPFGRTTFQGTLSSGALNFTGRENDGTGLHYFRARYYMPRLHRFVSEDPIGFGGGDANVYAYVFNSPTGYVDPLGLSADAARGPGPAAPAPIDCLDSSPPGTPSCGGQYGDAANQSACGPQCLGMALQMVRAAIIAAGGAAIAQQIIDLLSPLDLSGSFARGEEPFWEGLKPYRDGIRTNGESGKQRRFYERDRTHGDLEVYDREGRHLGSVDPKTGEQTKPAVPGRTNENVR